MGLYRSGHPVFSGNYGRSNFTCRRIDAFDVRRAFIDREGVAVVSESLIAAVDAVYLDYPGIAPLGHEIAELHRRTARGNVGRTYRQGIRKTIG